MKKPHSIPTLVLLSAFLLFILNESRSQGVPDFDSYSTVSNEIQWPLIGELGARATKDIYSSTWSIGAETLDRDYADYEAYKYYLDSLGAKRIRLQGGWAKCEKVKGKYNFNWLDKIVNDAYSRGIRPWIELSYGNPIYQGGGGMGLAGGIPTSHEALNGWDEWVKAMVNRYKDKVFEWEIWNEPDLNKENDGKKMAEFFVRTAKNIKLIQPNAQLIALGMAGNRVSPFLQSFMDLLKERNELHLVDIFTYHGYAGNPDDSYAHVRKMQEFIWSYNPYVNFMQGENGAPSGATVGALRNFSWTEFSQAKWDLRRMLGDHGRGIPTSLFTISEIRYNKTADHLSGLNTKGLLETNPDMTIKRPKLAYYAASRTMGLFDSQLLLVSQVHLKVNQPNLSVFQYESRATKASVITVWNNYERPAENFQSVVTNIEIEGKFETPVFVDLISGKVFQIPDGYWQKEGNRYMFYHIPVPDYPVLIADKNILHLKTNN